MSYPGSPTFSDHKFMFPPTDLDLSSPDPASTAPTQFFHPTQVNKSKAVPCSPLSAHSPAATVTPTYLTSLSLKVAAHAANGIETVVDIVEHEIYLKTSAEEACEEAHQLFEHLIMEISQQRIAVLSRIESVTTQLAASLKVDRVRLEVRIKACQRLFARLECLSRSGTIRESSFPTTEDLPRFVEFAAAADEGHQLLQCSWEHTHGRAGMPWQAVTLRYNEELALQLRKPLVQVIHVAASTLHQPL